MSEKELKYPIEGLCTVCGEPIFVFKSKAKKKEYLTNTKKYNDFHGCYEASWLPRGEMETEAEPKPTQPIKSKDPTEKVFEKKSRSNIGKYDSEPTFLGTSHDIERFGKITKIFYYREIKIWGGEKAEGKTDTINAGMQMELDSNLDPDPVQALKVLGNIVSKEIFERLDLL